MLFRIKAIILKKKIKPNFVKIIEDNLDENFTSHISLSQDQDEQDDFQERAQRGKRKILPPGPRTKSKRKVINGQTQWPRDPDITFEALSRSFFTCEFQNHHISFISGISRYPFMEGHYLVPMVVQDNFPFSLDIPENIISLCPTCHKRFHHGTNKDKFKMINRFFLSRQEALKTRVINISLSKLLSFYKVSDR